MQAAELARQLGYTNTASFGEGYAEWIEGSSKEQGRQG